MTVPPRFRLPDLLQLALVLIVASVLRLAYVHVATDDGRAAPAFVVQGDGASPAGQPEGAKTEGAEPVKEAPTEAVDLVQHLVDQGSFSARAPLADKEEPTAHVAPGYSWFVAQFARFDSAPHALVRWTQCGLGILTAGCLFFFARRAFDSALVALITGLLAAVHPFWIMNTAELNDGVLVTFLLAATLALGTRGSQSGGAFTSLLYGLGLAGLAMVRAALLPFAIVGLLWFLYRCRQVRHGWFNAILAFLGFANGLAPWAVRNWRHYEEPVPIVTSTYLHLWIGNNPSATGGPMDEATLRKSLPPKRLAELVAEPNQARRYANLGQDVWDEMTRDPATTVTRRWQAGLEFLVGDEWFRARRMSGAGPAHNEEVVAPSWATADGKWRCRDRCW